MIVNLQKYDLVSAFINHNVFIHVLKILTDNLLFNDNFFILNFTSTDSSLSCYEQEILFACKFDLHYFWINILSVFLQCLNTHFKDHPQIIIVLLRFLFLWVNILLILFFTHKKMQMRVSSDNYAANIFIKYDIWSNFSWLVHCYSILFFLLTTESSWLLFLLF